MAEAVVADAARQAEQILQQASDEAASVAQAAKAQADGARTLQLLKLEQQAATSLAQQTERLRADVARLAIAVAEKVLGQQLELAPQSVTAIVAQVLRGVCPARRALIRVHPADAPHLERELPSLRRAAEASEVTIERDPSVDRGGCVVDTPLVQADGRLSVQLEELSGAIEEQLRQAHAGAGEGESS